VRRNPSSTSLWKAAPGGVPTTVPFSQEKRFPALDLDRELGCIRDADHPYSPDGGLAVLYGNLAQDGCVVKTAGVDASILRFSGPARVFAHTLVPIGGAYLVAHYFSLLVFQGQAIGYLISDPLGRGSDLLGTAGRSIDYTVIGATAIWYVQIAALVSGHVCGLILAHDRALAEYDDPRVATRSQYWMLAVMVAFTCFGLSARARRR